MKTSLRRVKPSLFTGALTAFSLFGAHQVAAQQPTNWQTGFQPSVTPIMDQISWLNGFTLAIITVITLFVLGLLIYCFVKYNEKANPVASKTTHNTTIEVVWTVVPILILLVIVAPSIRLLYAQMELPEPDVTIKVTGYQWYWGYEYPEQEIGEYISTILHDKTDDAASETLRRDKALSRNEPIENYPRLLAVDNELVVPVGKVVQLDITSADVLHAVAMPSFGIKMDAVPGRLNSTWFRAEKEGLYYGQCSQICGSDHAYMPLAIRVVDAATFDDWAASAAEDLEFGWEILAARLQDGEKKTAQIANE